MSPPCAADVLPPRPPTLPHSRGHISGHVAARAKLNSREHVLTLFPVRQEGSNSAHGLNITARALIMFNATLWHQLEEWTEQMKCRPFFDLERVTFGLLI